MKKQLLLGSALLLSISAFSQNNQKSLLLGGKIAEEKKYNNSFTKASRDLVDHSNSSSVANKAIGPELTPEITSPNIQNSTNSPILSSAFYRLSGSMNVFGFLVSSSKPLNYSRLVNAVSFIQRKSPTYVTSPALPANAASGGIVAYIGKNDGASLSNWDSTLLYANATNWGRYPSGGLYNPPMNKDVNATYAVAMGPVTANAGGWIGSYYASKSVSVTPKNTAGSDQQFFSNVAPFSSATSPLMTKQNFPRAGFHNTDNGMFVAGNIVNDPNGTTNLTYGLRGAFIAKGVFTSGAFVWTPDSLIPPTELRTDGTKFLQGEPYMTWNPTGTVGYVVFIGIRQGAAPGSSNRGYQPIIYKTTNGGTTWSLQNGINFNLPAFDKVKESLPSVAGYTTAPSVEAPWFWTGEGLDVSIDKDDKLHIFTTVCGHISSHADSIISYYRPFTIGGFDYHWLYRPGYYPYLYDFIGDGASFTFKTIDSLGSEAPSETSGDPSFPFNEWGSATASESVGSDSRLQISRSYDGEFMAYSWAQSDSAIVTNKWNQFPNIFTRAYRVCDGTVSTDRYNISNPPSSALAAVRDHAYFHYMSSEMKAGASAATSATFAIPFTVHNNATTDGISPVNNYFAMSQIQFTFPSGCTTLTGLDNIAKTDASTSRIYPNPTKNSVNVAITLSQANVISVDIYNAIGQLISSGKTNGMVGENIINANLNNATPGVYFVKVKAGNTESTKKLIIE